MVGGGGLCGATAGRGGGAAAAAAAMRRMTPSMRTSSMDLEHNAMMMHAKKIEADGGPGPFKEEWATGAVSLYKAMGRPPQDVIHAMVAIATHWGWCDLAVLIVIGFEGQAFLYTVELFLLVSGAEPPKKGGGGSGTVGRLRGWSRTLNTMVVCHAICYFAFFDVLAVAIV